MAAPIVSHDPKMAVISNEPAITNLSLPRELRDLIYSHLLKPASTNRPRQRYRFYTNILATNRTIHAEAEEYLYENNDFVVVSLKYQLPMGELAPLKWIPLVSTKFAARLRKHPLRLHFVGNCGNGTQADIAAPKAQSAIIHRDHLPELCLAVQLYLSFTSGPRRSRRP